MKIARDRAQMQEARIEAIVAMNRKRKWGD
jgi:hypothetical protein